MLTCAGLQQSATAGLVLTYVGFTALSFSGAGYDAAVRARRDVPAGERIPTPTRSTPPRTTPHRIASHRREASPIDDPTPVPRQDTIATASTCGLPKTRTPTRSRRVPLRLLCLLTIQTLDSLMY